MPLKHDWPGWWAKMELHRSDLPKGRTLYLDLDSHVISNLDPILDYPGDLVMFRTRASEKQQMNKKNDTIFHRYQAATMLFDPGVMVEIYQRFKKNPEFYMNKFRSDQDIMGAWIPNQPVFPASWMKKLNQCRDMPSPPEGVIIVTGRPGDGSFRRLHEYPWLESTAREQKGVEKCT
jgi:alpha-N-acetylglucosamine transferase